MSQNSQNSKKIMFIIFLDSSFHDYDESSSFQPIPQAEINPVLLGLLPNPLPQMDHNPLSLLSDVRETLNGMRLILNELLNRMDNFEARLQNLENQNQQNNQQPQGEH